MILPGVQTWQQVFKMEKIYDQKISVFEGFILQSKRKIRLFSVFLTSWSPG